MNDFTPPTFREHAGRTGSDARKPPIIGLLVIAVVIATAAVTFGVILGRYAWPDDMKSMIDTIAPTAAQARDQGWVNIAERL